jgi:hypothetical protein
MSTDDNSNAKKVGLAVANGAIAAASVLGAINIIGLPVSYIANRFIYHTKGMRILLCIVTAILSIPILIGMIIYQIVTLGGMQKVHYFNYMPLKADYLPPPPPKDQGMMSWFGSIPTDIWNTVTGVLSGGFYENRTEAVDKEAYENSMSSILLPIEQKGDPQLAILEAVVQLSQDAAMAGSSEDALQLETLQRNLLRPSTSAHSV